MTNSKPGVQPRQPMATDQLFSVLFADSLEPVTNRQLEDYILQCQKRGEAWCSSLVYCDMEGFVLDEYGYLHVVDECGNYAYVPDGRFIVRYNPHFEGFGPPDHETAPLAIQTLAKAASPHPQVPETR